MSEMESENPVMNEGVKAAGCKTEREGKTEVSLALILSQFFLPYQASPGMGGKTCTHNALWLLPIRLE